MTTSRSNIIWIFGDQHRGQALGFRGDPNLHTPNIDRLAAEGVVFDQAVGGCPLCCPYRGSLISGRYPHQAVPGHERQLPPEMPTVATAFNEAGYDTAYFGKWHLDGFHEREGRAAMHIIPPERRGGFKTWCGYENNNAQFDCWVHGGEGDDAFHYRLPGYETDAMTELFIDDIRKRASGERPFFSVLSVQPPHNPYTTTEDWMGRHTPAHIELRPNVPPNPAIRERAQRDLAGYYAMIENLDWNLGRIRTALDELGIADDTHIIFFSDHGDMHGSHGQLLKTSPWEESIRVPCIIGGSKPYYDNKVGCRDNPVNHVDLAPTSLGLCGIDVPDWMAGTDYSAERIKDKATPNYPNSAYLQLVEPTGHANSIDRRWRGIVTRDGWKYVALEGQPWMLFNLNEDPYELANLAFNSIYGKVRQRLQTELAEWIERTDDSFSLPEL
ncbi:sulfatase family protein [Cerasicoccus arenae]|uniref:Sulfatase/phosphatase n=1 Tax=Cerasicoccus arenae TaxID=424488 RepID=A0A8J3DL62_9BACT|nr:sulfatase [Cerasicoccus arenae]MBK1858558.1 sulfatase [Cerasicoccus arenae]GHC06289.1 sulfatase/phosphatase [Cerasicoccus arenae]